MAIETKASGLTPPGARSAYMVLGMHRSGTSAVTQLLGLAGARLPENVMPGDEHNAKGYFEPWRIAMLNGERLRAAGSSWDDPFAFPFRPLEALDAGWVDQAVERFAEEYGETLNPLLKDPRVSVLLPLWRQVLDRLEIGARCVIALRHPLEVAGSLQRRDAFAPEKSVLVWASYMLAAEAYSRGLPRVVVSYDRLLADWRGEVARIEAAHGAPLPRLTPKAAKEIDRFLSPDLRHNRADGDLSSLGWAGEIAGLVLRWFEDAACGPEPDRAPLEAVAAALSARQAEMGALVSPVTRDLDQMRTELHEARQYVAYHQGELQALRAELEAYRYNETQTARALDAILTS